MSPTSSPCSDVPGNLGGGIYNANGQVSLIDSVVSGHQAIAGGGIINGSGALSLTNSAVHDNSSGLIGGGIDNGSGTVNLTNSVVSGNSAGSFGAGINNSNGTVNLINSVVTNNWSAEFGGGISSSDGTVNIINSAITNNPADMGSGGGIYSSGHLTLYNSAVSGNSAYDGGGISNYNGTMSVTSSTITNNSADVADGGGISNNNGEVNITSSIISDNSAVGNGPDYFGELTSAVGYNLVGNNSGCDFTAATGDQVGTPGSPIKPLLGPLQDNGGPTNTHALLEGSPAINAGSCADAEGNPITTDQRGATRPQGGCDTGSFELMARPPAVMVSRLLTW